MSGGDYMAYWNPVNYKLNTKPFSLGGGINNGSPLFDLKDDELTDAENIDTREYPAIHVRPPRSNFASITTPKMIGLYDGTSRRIMLVVDGTALKYYEPSLQTFYDLATGLTDTENPAKVENFEDTGLGPIAIFSNGVERKLTSVAATGDIPNMPATNKFTVHRNRMFAAKDKKIYYSALGEAADWTTANDAGNISVSRANGDLTAITTFNDHVLAMSEYSMHELYGTGPHNYYLADMSNEIGCISDKSVKEVNKCLYWLGRNNNNEGFIYQYRGGNRPFPVSDKIKGFMKRINWNYAYKAVSGTDGRRLYMAVPLDSSTTNNKVLVYDTITKIWHTESGSFVDFMESEGILYGLASDGNIKNMIDDSSTDETVAWYAISKPYYHDSLRQKKSYNEICMIVDLAANSELTLSVSKDAEGSNFTDIKTFTSSSDIQNMEKINIPLTYANNANWVRWKLSGTGPCTVHKIEPSVIVKRRS